MGHSLADVSISPEETKGAAMQFLDNLRRRKEAERTGVPVDKIPAGGNASGMSIVEAVGDEKLVFKARAKPSKSSANEQSDGPPAKKKAKVSFDEDNDEDERVNISKEPVSFSARAAP